MACDGGGLPQDVEPFFFQKSPGDFENAFKPDKAPGLAPGLEKRYVDVLGAFGITKWA